MKMKEVIAQTGLTDRAVRLYIENDLVTPCFSQTDSGRKSLDFSAMDVEALKKIATLRKAGFSIAEIKELKNNENCKETVIKFIEKTSLRVEIDMLIISSLQTLVAQDEITLDSVYQSLDAPTAQKSVPAEDLKLPKEEIFKRRFFLATGIIGFAIWIAFIVCRSKTTEYYRFTAIQNKEIFIFRTVINILFLLSSILLIALNLRTKSFKKTKTGRMFKTTAISAILLCVFLCSCFADFLNLAFSVFSPDFYSLTTDFSDYLELDEDAKGFSEDIYSIFPARIPPTAFLKKNVLEEDPVKYYYRYSWDTSRQFYIEAQWPLLPSEEYEEYKQRVFKNNKTVTAEKDKGDWKCLYFKDSVEEAKKKFYYLIFAYNDKTQNLRYIIAYYDGGDIAIKPHYLEMEW